MSECSLVSNSDTEIVVLHKHTGHAFTFHLEDGILTLDSIQQGHGPKDPGDVAADAHAFARLEAKRLQEM